MERRLLLSLCAMLVCIAFVSSELAITEPADIYNLGDKLFVTATGLKGYDQGNLNIDLVCAPNTTVNLLKISARAFPPEGGQAYSIPYKELSKQDLEIDDIYSIVGECSIKANLGPEVVASKTFTISKDIMVSATFDTVKYNPGETVTLSISAQKADGSDFIGQFETRNFTDISGEFTEEHDGSIEQTFVISNTQAPGSYFLEVEAFNTDTSGTTTNNGSINLFLIVKQVPTLIEPTMSSPDIIPGEEIIVSPKILDQSGGVIAGTIAIHIESPEGVKYDYNVQSGEAISIMSDTNDTKGIWTAYFVYNTLQTDATFEMLGLEKLDYTFSNSVLTIRNIGNVEYFGIVTVNIGEESHELELRIPVSGTKEYVLEAPEGEYDISVSDGDRSFSDTGFLTGNAVRVREKGGSVLGSGFSLMWIFLLFLGGSLLFIGIAMFRRGNKEEKTTFTDKVKNKFSGFKRVKKKEAQLLPDETVDTGMIDMTSTKAVTGAESTLVLHGDKVESTVVSIKLKDMDAFSEDIQHELVHIIKRNCGAKGVVDVKGDFIYLIYSPLVSRTYRNEFMAVTAARNIVHELSAYTKNLSGELEFGIGIHNGFMVAQKADATLKYTSIGNTVAFANKLAEEAENTVLMSDAARKHIMRDVVATKVGEAHNHNFYEVTGTKDKARDQAKLKDLLSRMDNT